MLAKLDHMTLCLPSSAGALPISKLSCKLGSWSKRNQERLLSREIHLSPWQIPPLLGWSRPQQQIRLLSGLGPLATSLYKSILFRTRERTNSGHAGYAMQLTGIRSGTIDELSHHDEGMTKQSSGLCHLKSSFLCVPPVIVERELPNHGSTYPAPSWSATMTVRFLNSIVKPLWLTASASSASRPTLWIVVSLKKNAPAGHSFWPRRACLLNCKTQKVQDQFLKYVIANSRYY